MKRTRQIEVLVCESNSGSDCGTWSTDYVDIPAATKEKNIEKRALDAAWKQYGDRDNIVHIAVYNIPAPEEMVVCKLCDNECSAETAHRHRGNYIGECCWDERLRVTE